MRWSRAFIPTLREDPGDVEAASHRLLLRGGFVRQLAAGLYSILPLGRNVLRKIERIIRQEMAAIGGQEFALPSLLPAEIWKESGRWDRIGEEMFRLNDRRQAEMCLGMTHEEIFTGLARNDLRSYRQLPQIWFQIQSKFRDEPRPKSGVLRTRQFTMKDSYSFDLTWEGLDRSFQLHSEAYRKIFSRCGLETLAVEASSGAMGGNESVEFMVLTEAGEDWVVRCSNCSYSANLEKAVSQLGPVEDPADAETPERFATPNVRTIEELARFEGGAPAERQMKTLVYMVDGNPTLFVLRGDHELNEVKAVECTGTLEIRPAGPEEIREALGASAGSLGAVGVDRLPVYVDEALQGRRGMTTGANEDGFHLRHVDVGRDIPSPRFIDLREVREGERCAKCGTPLEVQRSIEVGHIFKLGRHYSDSMGATVLDAEGNQVPIVMGSYGIGLERAMGTIVEAHHDSNGICWPVSVAPYEVVVVPIRIADEQQRRTAERLYTELCEAGIEALLDDRDERPGVKFKDADLIGIPFRIVVGPRALGRGNVELFERDGMETNEVRVEQAAARVGERIR
ncbi:MAG: proline--tRNA ligase [Myxococcota bacterium]